MKKLNFILVILLFCSLAFCGELDDYLIILHSNDIHGRAITTNEFFGYAGIKRAKENLQKAGACVFLLDAGDYIQGMPIINLSKGANAIDFMNRANYDVATVGNHEFDYGYENLLYILKSAKFKVIVSNILDNKNNNLFDTHTILIDKKGNKIGVFGLNTPECSTKVNPNNIKGLKFLASKELYDIAQNEIDFLKKENCSLIICLGHLGEDLESNPNRSIDIIENTKGINLFVDGHSHTRMIEGKNENGTIRVSTGAFCKSIGYVAYKYNNGMYEYVKSGLYDRNDSFISIMANGKVHEVDRNLKKYIDNIQKNIEKKYNTISVETLVDLNGDRISNRTEETNLGDLSADALLYIGKEIDKNCVASILNGGGIRASIKKGKISILDIKSVFPFSNNVCILKLSGRELLEALEAATCETPKELGAFPQISGMDISVFTNNQFIKEKKYENSTYYKPKLIQRVVINSVNGHRFDINSSYTIVTTDFLCAGGDTYYSFIKPYRDSGEDTGILLEDALVTFIRNKLNNKIDEKYKYPQNRIKLQ